MNPAEAAAARTSQKLRFAQLTIDELSNSPSRHTGDDFERSHHEAFLFHLYGAIDSFLQEINIYCSCGLSPTAVTMRSLRESFAKRGRPCAEFEEIAALAGDSDTYLGNTRDIRNFAAHRGGLPMAHYFNGPSNLVHPTTREEFACDALELFAEWLSSVATLLERARSSLISHAA
jgi:hypothetical protein